MKYLITILLALFHTTTLLSQLETLKPNLSSNLEYTSIQDSSDGKISIKNSEGRILLEINDEVTGGSLSFPPISTIGNPKRRADHFEKLRQSFVNTGSLS